MSKAEILRFAYGIHAPIEHLYRAFTNTVGFQEWLCQNAFCEPYVGGGIFLSWPNGYRAIGEYTHLELNRRVIFTWRGSTDPSQSRVEVSFSSQQDGSNLVIIEHHELGLDEDWLPIRREIERGWIIGLENLVSVMETGMDKRIVDRPIIGLGMEDSANGIRITEVIPGRSADRAGLQKDDRILSINNQLIQTVSEFVKQLQKHRVGDHLSITYERSGQKQTVTVELMRFPLPEVAQSAAALAEQARAIYQSAFEQLELLLQGLSEEKAGQSPSPNEWSVKAILAHLIQTERDYQFWLVKTLSSMDFSFSENHPARIQATLSVYPTLAELIHAFHLAGEETIQMLAALPEDFVARKSSFWTVAFNIPFFASHTQTHLQQIQHTIKTVESS
jgi:uncharacterized protein YndB with AHSA1/START domain